MRSSQPKSTFIRLSFVVFLLSIVVTVIRSAQDHDVPVSIDGIRCDSCGSECAVMCGSKIFRACCYNYIKKRSVPWSKSSGPETAGDGESLDAKLPSSLAGNEAEEATYLLPVSLREIMGGGVFHNAFENRKYGRVMI